jgi:hypothetical protein
VLVARARVRQEDEGMLRATGGERRAREVVNLRTDERDEAV